jgi:hypothetical protein
MLGRVEEDPSRQETVFLLLLDQLFVMVSASLMSETRVASLPLLLADEVSLCFCKNVLESAIFRVWIRRQIREIHVLARLSVC